MDLIVLFFFFFFYVFTYSSRAFSLSSLRDVFAQNAGRTSTSEGFEILETLYPLFKTFIEYRAYKTIGYLTQQLALITDAVNKNIKPATRTASLRQVLSRDSF